MKQKQDKGPMWAVIAVLVALAATFSWLSSSSNEPAAKTATTASAGGVNSNASQPLAGARLTPTQAKNYRQYPSSMGYSSEDRDFLREHGVSETQARAAETVAAQHGAQ